MRLPLFFSKPLLVSLGLLVLSPVVAQKKGLKWPETSLSKAQVEAHMRFLAADELLGRRTGDQGALVAARYIAEQFRQYGATPVPGYQSYFQAVPFEKMGAVREGLLEVEEEKFALGTDWILMAGASGQVSGQPVYAGYGLDDAQKGWDDYKDLDVKGKIVLVQSGTPEATSPSDIVAASALKRSIAARKGAIAVIELFSSPTPWQFVVRFFAGERIALAPEGEVPASLPHVWVNAKEAKITQAVRKATTIRLTTSGRSIERVVSYNVAAYIQGTDPKLKEEYVMLSAHLDHVGVGKQGGRAYTAEDSIFNGARDNVFGCVAILSAAQALAEAPPKRSVLLLAVTGEEVGLLGSRYYANHPMLPLNRCIFNLNNDGAGYNDTSIAAVIGLDRTGAKAEIEQAFRKFGLGVFADPAPEQGLFDRSDNVNFAAKGIPSPTFSPGFREFNDELMKYYHQVADNPESIDFDYLLRFSKAYAYAARLIADRATPPSWVVGDKYEAAAKQLYQK